jgi:hypothetical protein
MDGKSEHKETDIFYTEENVLINSIKWPNRFTGNIMLLLDAYRKK